MTNARIHRRLAALVAIIGGLITVESAGPTGAQ